MVHPRITRLLLVVSCLGGGVGNSRLRAGSVAGMDAMPGRDLVKTVDPAMLARWGNASPYLRIRGLPDPTDPAKSDEVEAERPALQQLGQLGFRPVALVRWAPKSWRSGVREGGGQRLPLDLREAYARARAYTAAYGGLRPRRSEMGEGRSGESQAGGDGTDSVPGFHIGFEFDNEPDIGFVQDNPETYAAFLKAGWLGVHDADKAGNARGDGRSEMGDGANPTRPDGTSGGGAERGFGPEDSRGDVDVRGVDGDSSTASKLNAHRLPLKAFYTWRPGVVGVPAVGGRFGRAARRGDGTLQRSLPGAKQRGGGRAPLRSADEQIGDGTGEAPGSTLPAPSSTPRVPRVVMAPMAFPPGPYFEQLLRNGLLSYTDAFNYHYYGAAADFTGAYRAFEDAVATVSEMGDRRWEMGTSNSVLNNDSCRDAEVRRDDWGEKTKPEGGRAGNSGREHRDGLTSEPHLPSAISHLRQRTLPVLLTEYGYNRLTEPQARTVAGRVAQWRWFRDVAGQIEDLRIAGPMAFVVRPYLENDSLEFGLTMAPAELAEDQDANSRRGAEAQREDTGRTNATADLKAQASGLSPRLSYGAGGLTFTAADFADSETVDSTQRPGPISHLPSPISVAAPAAPWMRWIGTRVGANEMSPALAWLIQEGIDHPYTPRDWMVTTPAPSPVVLDFVAGPTLEQFKRYNGYVATESGAGASEGAGDLILYNFARIPQQGRIEVTPQDLLSNPAALDRDFELAPMARVTVPLRFRVPADRFGRHDWSVRFVPADSHEPCSIFATAFYPNLNGMGEYVITRFASGTARQAPAEAGNREWLLHRRTEPGEGAPVASDGRWLVTPGDALTESAPGRWTFKVAPFTGDSIPAVAELPLPDNFVFPEDALLTLQFRLADPPGRTVENGTFLHVYFRTANGNIYGVMPWSLATGEWDSYLEAKGNYTLLTDGRTNLPWRFKDNRIVSLVLMSWRRGMPLTYEVEGARIVRIER